MEVTEYVSYPVALSLKAAGFDEPCEHFYDSFCAIEDEYWFIELGWLRNWNTPGDVTSAPTFWQAQKWLREKKGIYAYCEPNCLKKWVARAIDLAKNEDLLFDGEMFDDFWEAAEYAFSAALELIKKGE